MVSVGRLCLAGVLVVACTSPVVDPSRGGVDLEDQGFPDARAGFEPPAGFGPIAPPVLTDPIGGVEPIPGPDAAAEQTDGAVADARSQLDDARDAGTRDASTRDVRARDAARIAGAAGDSGLADAAGVAGSGGAGGAAGTFAAAGAGGSAGVTASGSVQVAASATAAAGRTGGAPDPCAPLERDYAAALAKALACDFFALGPTCQQNADTSLSCPGCKVAVQDPSGLVALSNQWQASGCARRNRGCPAIVCANLAHGICVPSGSAGVCDGVTAVMPASGP